MFSPKGPAPNPNKERVARHLRAADTHAREGRYDDALLEIENALRLDPKNYYARSFLERVRFQMQKAEKRANQKLQSESQTEEQKINKVSELLRMAEHYIDQKEYALASKEIAKVYVIDPQNSFAFAYSDLIEKKIAAEATGAPVEALSIATVQQPSLHLTQEPGSPTPDEGAPGIERASLTMYRELLREMWFDGKLTPEEVEELRNVREMFGITEEDHREVEKQVHIDAYVEALRIAWRDGAISSNEGEILGMMREKFGISMDEHMSAEAKILWAKSSPSAKGVILIIEDERSLLLSLAARLKKQGYEVETAETVEQAMERVQAVAPSLILSDLMFGEGNKTGLEFYQYVRSTPQLKDTPFLLMSSISDQFVVRAGMRMGVDNFIAKPFNLELLLATIEGKLRS
ncbi:MAG: response regulator [Ignavibacteriales bacterium]|nr:response regulator [Ignavibacteriales bacterium]